MQRKAGRVLITSHVFESTLAFFADAGVTCITPNQGSPAMALSHAQLKSQVSEVDALMASCGLTDDDLEAALERAAADAAEAVTAAASAGAAVAASAASSKL